MPPRAWETPSQSANEAPSGRVTMYANQNATIGFMWNRQYALAKMAAKANPDARYPRWNVIAVTSPLLE